MAKISLNINHPDVTQQDINTLERYLNGLPPSTVETISHNTSSFSTWLREKNYNLYRRLHPYIDEILNALKNIASDILDGVGRMSAAVIVTPLAGIYEGVKEGFENGLEAGVKKGLKTMGDVLDDIFS